jgi:A/G-specific adenine glycosylase
VLREAAASVSADALASAWSEDDQRERALAGLLADGLVQRTNEGSYALPA